MNGQKGFITRFGEMVDRYRAERGAAAQAPAPARHRGRLRWLGRHMVPNVGTLLMVVVLLLTVPSLAAPLRAPAATSTSTISYQGRLADSSGNPLTGKYNLEFRIYDVPAGGVPLWTEMWTGANAVDVSDGLFNVMRAASTTRWLRPSRGTTNCTWASRWAPTARWRRECSWGVCPSRCRR